MKTIAFAAVALSLVAATSINAAQPPAPAAAGPQIVRGTVTTATPDKVVVKKRDGKTVTIGLTKDWTVQVNKPVTVAEIKPGSFIGTAEMPQEDGVGRSLEVHVFPPGVKIGEGHYSWDLKKGSMMTNGTVGKVTAGAKGRELEVTYSTGTRRIVVPNGVPIVQIVPGDRSLVTPGVKVFIVAIPTPNGLVANRLSVGEKGKAPPM